jgi:hypothetical protein
VLDLAVAVDGVAIERHAAAPTLVFGLRVTAPLDVPVHALLLRTRVVIEAGRRRYTDDERGRLVQVFGQPEQWRTTLRAVTWADVSTSVPGFAGTATVALWVPCSYDMDVAATAYLHGVDGADVPLAFRFSGTAFVRGLGGIAVVALSHDLEATWAMPAGTWPALMDAYFPDGRWLRLRPDRFDALARYRGERALPSWDATIDDLLAAAPVRSTAPAVPSPT